MSSLDASRMKIALSSYLRGEGHLLAGDRLEITAYHDPRRAGGLTE